MSAEPSAPSPYRRADAASAELASLRAENEKLRAELSRMREARATLHPRTHVLSACRGCGSRFSLWIREYAAAAGDVPAHMSVRCCGCGAFWRERCAKDGAQ